MDGGLPRSGICRRRIRNNHHAFESGGAFPRGGAPANLQ
jgi:hypothetical protein